MNAIFVPNTILVITVNNLALMEAQVLSVLDMEHVMQEHLHPVGNVNALLVGPEQIGKSIFYFFAYSSSPNFFSLPSI